MLKTLLKKQMAEIFRNYFYDPKKNKMRSRGATIAYIVLYALLMVGLLGGIFALMAVGLCGPLVEGGMDWLYYLLVGLIAVFLGTFGSVFSTYSSLYLSKDNDLLLSLPIPVRCVMASRLLGVYLLGLMYAALALGLKMPNLTWTNETTPIKQSGCVMLSLFANWFYALALGGLYFLCGNALSAAVYLAIFAVVTAAGSALLLHWVKQRGARIFAAL